MSIKATGEDVDGAVTTSGLQSLDNFFRSVAFDNPYFAARIAPDVRVVALASLNADKTEGQDAANRLRQAAFDLPVIQSQVLNNALTDLGY